VFTVISSSVHGTGYRGSWETNFCIKNWDGRDMFGRVGISFVSGLPGVRFGVIHIGVQCREKAPIICVPSLEKAK